MSKKNYLFQEQPLTQERKKNHCKVSLNDLSIVKPVTINQSKFFKSYKNSDFFILSGYPGTGKSFISLYKALEDALTDSRLRVIIIRSAVPSRDVGALPGDLNEKLEVYELPYKKICADLFNRADAYDRLKEQKVIQFVSTSYLRSLTFDGSIVIVDEFQNMLYSEIKTVVTRIGENSKAIFCGDSGQNDLPPKQISCSNDFLSVSSKIPYISHIEFDVDDIVRSGFVKDWIIAEMKYFG